MRSDGGPAYPQPVATSNGAIYAACEKGDVYAGMSLRDWFAGQALASCIAVQMQQMVALASQIPDGQEDQFQAAANEGIAALAYEIADAMLAERAKGAPTQ